MVIYREMLPQDLEDVARLEREAFSEPWSKAAFEESLSKDYYKFYVATDNGQHIATVGLTISLDEADVSNVAVAASRRNEGIGSSLLKYAIRDGVSMGISAYTLEVRESNHAAIRMYEKLGFVSEGIRPDFYSNPKENAIIMWRR